MLITQGPGWDHLLLRHLECCDQARIDLVICVLAFGREALITFRGGSECGGGGGGGVVVLGVLGIRTRPFGGLPNFIKREMRECISF